MSFNYKLVLSVLASLPLAASAQQGKQQFLPTDASAEVPAFGYSSVFSSYQPTPREDVTPDKAWRGANDEMARLGGHAGHMKTPDATSVATPEVASGKPSEAARPEASGGRTDPHSGHGAITGGAKQ